MEPPPANLPAAHSMDTEWFAIDDHGHVAVFDSGEGGGVPHAHFGAWHSQSMWSELLEEMLRLAPPGGIRFVAEGAFEVRERDYDRPLLVTSPGKLDLSYAWEVAILLELEAPRDVVQLEGWLGSAYVLGCEQPLVYARCLPQTLHEVWDELGIVRGLLHASMAPSRVGVFGYGCDDYSGGPYQRYAEPIGAALRVESLATSLRRRLGDVKLAGADFRRDKQIQPFEHLPSSIWGQTWIGTDGTVHEAD
jgi:hypothetical protein